ncbi:hypothetical protein BH11ARM2_BH11ARM2_21380 [soil metagenome]
MRRIHHALDEAHEGETSLYEKDGLEYRAQVRVTPVRSAAGKVANWIIVQHELDERDGQI